MGARELLPVDLGEVFGVVLGVVRVEPHSVAVEGVRQCGRVQDRVELSAAVVPEVVQVGDVVRVQDVKGRQRRVEHRATLHRAAELSPEAAQDDAVRRLLLCGSSSEAQRFAR